MEFPKFIQLLIENIENKIKIIKLKNYFIYNNFKKDYLKYYILFF